ncbi:MAG TPA: YcaO-like family protein [Polyangiaceae bacterium]|nr:YcaO-like family protein [Polyangiaceae bacterium]
MTNEKSDPAARLDALLARHPLPTRSRRPELFTEKVTIGGLEAEVAGIAVEVDGECITGSAASVGAPPVDRAYYELVERLAAVAFWREPERRFPVRDRRGTVLGEATPGEISLPAAPDGLRWARSNGVALGYDFAAAAHRARLELVERDAVLRSWYGEGRPERLIRTTPQLSAELGELYDVEAHAFGADEANVVGVFAFPRGVGPLVYGFAAESTLESATLGAARECVQRLAFLWDAELPGASPAPSATPDFHQEFYLYPGNAPRIVDWLSGGHERFRGAFGVSRDVASPTFVDITPDWLRGLSVAQAVPRGHAPLCFGWGHPLLRLASPELMVHPIA